MKRRGNKQQSKYEVFLRRVIRIIPNFEPNQLQGPCPSIRVNTLRSKMAYPDPVSWAPHCYWTPANKHDLSHSNEAEQGIIYLQNAASFIPPIVLDPKPRERILDMCAAPGGKASHIAAITSNQAELWVNDNSRARLSRMLVNFQRLGVKPRSSTLYAIENVRRELPSEYFHKILLDVPCSGEGMLDLSSARALDHWSVAHIKRLQRIQKKAITTAWDLLRPGGLLVYSTCTIAPEENEAVIDYLLRRRESAKLVPIDIPMPNRIPAMDSWNGKQYSFDLADCMRLAPSRQIEAFFVAAIRKGGP